MKVIIQIPCFNEEATLPLVLAEIPRVIEGVDELGLQVIDDGSTDQTAEAARIGGADSVLRLGGKNRRWLGRAFRLGAEEALRQGADIVVNTDGDNQYPSHCIPSLIRPILEGKADVVIGDRRPAGYKEFSRLKRVLHWVGNLMVSLMVCRRVPDAVSGFRAFSREALEKIKCTSNHTYKLDTLVQAYSINLTVHWLAITPNPATRPSRLFRNVMEMSLRSGANLLRLTIIYRPLWFSILAAIPLALGGIFSAGKFVLDYLLQGLPNNSAPEYGLLLASGICFLAAVQVLVLGGLGETLLANRRMVERAARKGHSPGGAAFRLIDGQRSRGGEGFYRTSNTTNSERRESKVSNR